MSVLCNLLVKNKKKIHKNKEFQAYICEFYCNNRKLNIFLFQHRKYVYIYVILLSIMMIIFHFSRTLITHIYYFPKIRIY